ncbi:MAG: YkgJ family cysteine cluster protein [Verrucomicrobiota bacterium]
MADIVHEADPSTAHPCLSCGACCATFRVSFYWAEAATRGLPPGLTEKVNPWLSCMAGTNAAAPRCAALEGQIGIRTGCRVYPQRPSPCREVQPGDSQCAKARANHGLPPLPF